MHRSALVIILLNCHQMGLACQAIRSWRRMVRNDKSTTYRRTSPSLSRAEIVCIASRNCGLLPDHRSVGECLLGRPGKAARHRGSPPESLLQRRLLKYGFYRFSPRTHPLQLRAKVSFHLYTSVLKGLQIASQSEATLVCGRYLR